MRKREGGGEKKGEAERNFTTNPCIIIQFIKHNEQGRKERFFGCRNQPAIRHGRRNHQTVEQLQVKKPLSVCLQIQTALRMVKCSIPVVFFYDIENNVEGSKDSLYL